MPGKRKRRLAQIQTEMFIYILSIIIASLLLVYGYSAIKGFKGQEEFVELLRFRLDVKNMVQSIKTSYGDAALESVIVPSGYRDICFVDIRKSYATYDQFTDPIIKDSVKDSAKQNVFMVDSNSLISRYAFYAGNISVDTGGLDFVCIPVQGGVIKVKLEAMGSYVQVGPW